MAFMNTVNCIAKELVKELNILLILKGKIRNGRKEIN